MKRILLMVIKLLGHVPAWFWRICSFAKDTEEQRYSIEEKYNYIREIAIKANKAGKGDHCQQRRGEPAGRRRLYSLSEPSGNV